MKPSKYQEDIYKWIKTGKGNAVIQAVAGSGKTTTIIECTKLIPAGKKSIFLAFNSAIQKELRERLPQHIQSRTLHSLGLSMFMPNTNKRPEVENDKLDSVIRQVLKENNIEEQFWGDYFPFLKQMIPKLKATLADYTKYEILEEVAIRFNIENNIDDFKMILLKGCMEKCKQIVERIDFDDMIWLPIVNNWQTDKFDYVFVDECLPAETRILLADGTEKSIKEIVDKKLICDVITFNHNTNKQEIKKIVGWSQIPIKNKKMLRIEISKKYFIKTKNGYIKSKHILFCTNNHKIYTQRGYIRADELKKGDKIQYEISHGNKNLKYKNGRISKRFFNENSSVKCHICNITFASKAQLGSHMRIHTNYKGNLMSKEGSAILSQKAYERNQYFKNNPEIRKRIGQKIRKKMLNGKSPIKFGGYIGNGYISKHEAILLTELLKHDKRWIYNYPIKTGYYYKDKYNYPSNYKVDLAFPEHKLAVEVHGEGHKNIKSRKKDEKKQALLRKLGWKILEIWNYEIDNDISDCVKKILQSLIGRSPEEFEVFSIKEVEYKDDVYDIETEDNHNFYAEGVLVHNCQDLNRVQFELIKKICNKNTRVILVGDKKQAIYGFRGADSNSMNNLKEYFKAKEFPLSISYRCPKAVVKLAQEIVDDIECSPTAKNGVVENIEQNKINDLAEDGNLILCRTNAPLVQVCFSLIRDGKKATIMGRDIGKNLIKIIDKYTVVNLNDLNSRILNLRSLHFEKLDMIEQGKYDKKRKNSLIAQVDACDTILALSENVETIDELKHSINRIFTNDRQGIVCSTVHKAKGLEANIVFIIKYELMPHPMATEDEEVEQEMNIKYVAITRAKETLYLIE